MSAKEGITTLTEHLGAALTAQWRGGNRTMTATALQAALAADAGLKAEAAARRAKLEALDQRCNGQIHRRCAVSAIHLRALRAALD